MNDPSEISNCTCTAVALLAVFVRRTDAWSGCPFIFTPSGICALIGPLLMEVFTARKSWNSCRSSAGRPTLPVEPCVGSSHCGLLPSGDNVAGPGSATTGHKY